MIVRNLRNITPFLSQLADALEKHMALKDEWETILPFMSAKQDAVDTLTKALRDANAQIGNLQAQVATLRAKPFLTDEDQQALASMKKVGDQIRALSAALDTAAAPPAAVAAPAQDVTTFNVPTG